MRYEVCEEISPRYFQVNLQEDILALEPSHTVLSTPLEHLEANSAKIAFRERNEEAIPLSGTPIQWTLTMATRSHTSLSTSHHNN